MNALVGCSSPVYIRGYAGPDVPKDQVAYLISKTHGPFRESKVHIAAFDGRRYGLDGDDGEDTPMFHGGPYIIEILPGPHTLRVWYYFQSSYSTEFEVQFDAKQGHIYSLDAIDSFLGLGPSYVIISDVTEKERMPMRKVPTQKPKK